MIRGEGSPHQRQYGGWEMNFRMTPVERERFLAGIHIGVMSIAQGDSGPLTVPIWYSYEPGGEIQIVTGKSTLKAKLLEKVDRFSLCVQDENPPYKYVSVEGPITGIENATIDRDIRPLAHRYFGEEAGDLYLQRSYDASGPLDEILIRMKPERWLSVDFAKDESMRDLGV